LLTWRTGVAGATESSTGADCKRHSTRQVKDLSQPEILPRSTVGGGDGDAIGKGVGDTVGQAGGRVAESLPCKTPATKTASASSISTGCGVDGKKLSKSLKDKCGGTLWLNIVKHPERSRHTERSVGKMTVQRHVNGENKCRKANMEPIFECPNESAATLVQVGTQTLERDC
jgi:hypothetical protein